MIKTYPLCSRKNRRLIAAFLMMVNLWCITSLTYEHIQTFWILAVDDVEGKPIKGIYVEIINLDRRPICSGFTDHNGWAVLTMRERSTNVPIEPNTYIIRMLDQDSLGNGGFFDTVETPLDFSQDTLVVAMRLFMGLGP